MSKRAVAILCLALILPAIAFAGIKKHTVKEKRGQQYYLKQCSQCHGQGNRGGNLAYKYEWIEYFKNDAEVLKSFHADEKVLEYLNSEAFKTKHQNRILNFLLEFAADSDAIPSCNN